jgi:cAMP phosphodiesterase
LCKIILELIPKKSIAIYLLKIAKKKALDTNNSYDDIAYEFLLNSLIKIGFISETEAINEKLTDIKSDVKEMHDCLDNTRDLLAEQLKVMAEASNNQHAELAAKIGDLEKVKNKYTTYAMLGMAFIAGTGWLSGHSINVPHLLKFFGM